MKVSEEAHALVREIVVSNPALLFKSKGNERLYLRDLYRQTLAYLDFVDEVKRGEVELVEPPENALFEDSYAPNLPPDHPFNQRSKLWGKIDGEYVFRGPDWDARRASVLEHFAMLKPLPPDQILQLGRG